MASRVRVDVEVMSERHNDPPEEGFDPARSFAWGSEALAEPFRLYGVDLPPSASIGIS